MKSLLSTVLAAFCLGALAPAAFAAAPAGSPARPKDTVIVDAKTEAVIKGGLKYLASKQQASGAWGFSGDEQRRQVAMTGYTLMAFQAAGHLPGEGEYGKNVTAGMNYLLDSIGPDGLYNMRSDGQYMYSHGIATIALAELYGQTKSPLMRPKLDKAVKVIISAQATEPGHEGGWRYRPIAKDADISVTVLSLVAIRAAKNGGLEVPQRTIDEAVLYVKRCQDERTGGFCYQPQRDPGFARTAAAIYSLQVCGLYDDPMVKKGSAYLFDNLREDHEWFTYGNFYAACAQYMIGGDTWQKWYPKTKDILMAQVIKQGDMAYWEARGRGGVGPTFCTAVYTMILAMPYHYIPLYQR